MIRLPFLPTLIVAAAVAAMVGLGIWQLGRAGEKEALLAEYSRAAELPPVDLDPLIARGSIGAVPLAFRRALISCRPGDAAPSVRAARNLAGDSGYGYFLPCRPGVPGFAGRLQVNIGWAAGPSQPARMPGGVVAGTLGQIRAEGPIVLTSAAAAPTLLRSAPPAVEDIPNNHRSYAAQWFFFALAATIIYLLALRRRGVEARARTP